MLLRKTFIFFRVQNEKPHLKSNKIKSLIKLNINNNKLFDTAAKKIVFILETKEIEMKGNVGMLQGSTTSKHRKLSLFRCLVYFIHLLSTFIDLKLGTEQHLDRIK